MLIKSVLKSKIKQALEDTAKVKDSEAGAPPMIHSKAAKAIAAAYDDYASQAQAGPLLISVPGQKILIEQGLSAPSFAGLGPAILLYWTPIMWAGAGFIPANPTIPVALSGIAPEIAAMIAGTKPDSMDTFADKLSTILHTYTGQLMVLATTTSIPPVVSTIPVM